MHNDYGFLVRRFSILKSGVYGEAPFLFYAGRALQGYIATWLFQLVSRMDQLAVIRLVSFICMLGFLFLFEYFLRKKAGLERFWSQLIALGVVLLPVSQLFILWTISWVLGFFSVFWAMLAYVFLEFVWPVPAPRGLTVWKRFALALAAVVFMQIALFTYAPSAVFVFVCTFCYVFLPSRRENNVVFKILLRDILFFGFCMLSYFAINKFFLFQHPPVWALDKSLYSRSLDQYSFTWGYDFMAKARLFWSTFLWSFSGIWHPFIGEAGAIVNGLLVVFTSAIVLSEDRGGRDRKKRTKDVFFSGLWVSGAFLLCFFLANSPAFFAKNCIGVNGYRVLLPASALGFVLLSGGIMHAAATLRARKSGTWLRAGAIILVAVMALITFGNLLFHVLRAQKDMRYVQKQVAAKGDRLSHVIATFRPKKEWDGEFDESLNAPPWVIFYVQYLLENVLGHSPVDPVTVDEVNDKIMYYDDFTLLLDMNGADRTGGTAGSPVSDNIFIRLSTSDNPRRRIEIQRNTAGYLMFRERTTAGVVPYWLIQPAETNLPWVELNMDGAGQTIEKFVFEVYGPNPAVTFPLACGVKGSLDGRDWEELSMAGAKVMAGGNNVQVYHILNPKKFTRYRFYLFLPINGPVAIGAMRLIPLFKEGPG